MDERVGQLVLVVRHAEMGCTHYCGRPKSKKNRQILIVNNQAMSGIFQFLETYEIF